MGIRAEIKKALEQGRLFDFVSNNYYRMSKDELKDLFKESDYACYQILEKLARARSYNYEEAREVHKELLKDYCSTMIENLNDFDFFNEEE